MSGPAVPAPRGLSAQHEDRRFLAAAAAAAAQCGVTRVADITGLDRLGLPVWQAVRPVGRALSVHQGKGASPTSARIGALCEAIESHCAENAPADGPRCRFSNLPKAERAPDISDYWRSRSSGPSDREAVQWSRAADLLTGGTCYLPHPLVSLDYTSGLPSPFDRSSNGLGAGPDEGFALRTALLEAVERDALAEWERRPDAERLSTLLDPEDITLDWFQAWRSRLAALDVDVHAYLCPSVPDIPVLACVIAGPGEFGTGRRSFYGSAADGDPQVALFKAMAEAIQSRLTLIAGVRDDMLPSVYSRPQARWRSGPPMPDEPVAWASIEPVCSRLESVAERLAAAGYRQIAVKRLDRDLAGVAVAKIFVPGLGSSSRKRRRAG